MLELLLPSWIAGMLLTTISGPLGAFVVWRRMSYFGDTLSHAALLGVALGFAFNIAPFYAVLGLMLLLGLILTVLESQKQLPIDTLLGILAHSALSIGLVVISLMSNIRIDLMGYLFGDLLSITYQDVWQILIGVIVVLAILIWQWHKFLYITVSEELAFVNGINTKQTKLCLILLIAITIGLSMKFVGALIITSLLIMPAATAKYYANTPEKMAFIAVLFGMIAICGGLLLSVYYNTPTGPSVVVVSGICFLITLLIRRRN
ncbi:zinc ABC transporter permease subunit ZnuB [Utexia brackfieldae]|uniref:zinc ABC transporter permease subunit ZnuB n=1 Tax=Utexia brackfieldae TaxID=3074108 RepID=UPI00370D5791